MEEIQIYEGDSFPSRFASRVTNWQKRNRGHVRDGLKKTQDDRVARNRARRLLEESSRAKKCDRCNTTRNLEVAHKDNHPSNNALSNLAWRCRKCHGSHEGRYPKKLD